MWVKLDDQSFANAKLWAAGLAANGLHWRVAAWCGAQGTDGYVPRHVAEYLAIDPPSDASLFDRLTAPSPGQTRGLWLPVDDGGFRLTDFLAYNPSAADMEAKRRRREAAGRIGGQASAAARRAKTTAKTSANGKRPRTTGTAHG